MDAWDKWRVVCLTILSVEDVEDLYLFGFTVAGFLLIGLGGALVYRKIGKTAARKETPVLSVEIKDRFGAVNDSVMGIKTGNDTVVGEGERFGCTSGRLAPKIGQSDWDG